MLTDVVGLGLALAAIQFASSSRDRSNTYGLYRLEVLASLANAFLLFGVAIYVLYEAVQRFSDPPAIAGPPMLIVAAVGLGVNLVSFQLLRAGAAESLNVKGAFLEVMADALGSAGVLLAGAIVLTTGWPYADAIIGAGIGLFILPRTWRLGRAALRILLESAPSHIDVEKVEDELLTLEGVAAVHDLHVWTLTSGVDAASGHLVLGPAADLGEVLGRATRLLEDEFGITHPTLQCEPPAHEEKKAAV
jgi:cobalt-zinc-cadmium efflux system protein